jgi:hypothetical protein
LAAGIGREPQHAAPAAHSRLEAKDRLDCLGARARHLAGRGPIGIDPKMRRISFADMGFQGRDDRLGAVDRLDAPGQGQQIAPMAVRMEQARKQHVGSRKGPLEPCKPVCHGGRDGLCCSGLPAIGSRKLVAAGRHHTLDFGATM